MPHTTLRILNITLVAGNDVNVYMEDTLPGCWPYVNADIVAVGIELLVQPMTLLGDQLHAGVDLFGRQVEKAGDMSFRDDQRMTRTYPISISRAVRKFAIQRHPFWVFTKQAWIIGVSLFLLFFFRRQT